MITIKESFLLQHLYGIIHANRSQQTLISPCDKGITNLLVDLTPLPISSILHVW